MSYTYAFFMYIAAEQVVQVIGEVNCIELYILPC